MSGRRRKNCQYCGRYFKPHPRVGNRQKWGLPHETEKIAR